MDTKDPAVGGDISNKPNVPRRVRKSNPNIAPRPSQLPVSDGGSDENIPDQTSAPIDARQDKRFCLMAPASRAGGALIRPGKFSY
jgi:hypothetical protein